MGRRLGFGNRDMKGLLRGQEALMAGCTGQSRFGGRDKISRFA